MRLLRERARTPQDRPTIPCGATLVTPRDGDVMHRGVERAVVYLRRRIRHRVEHDVLRIVLENSRSVPRSRRARSSRRRRQASRCDLRGARARRCSRGSCGHRAALSRPDCSASRSRSTLASAARRPTDRWSQSPVVIQAPRRDSRSERLIRAMNSAGVCASRSCTEERPKPPLMKCTCASMKPGRASCRLRVDRARRARPATASPPSIRRARVVRLSLRGRRPRAGSCRPSRLVR